MSGNVLWDRVIFKRDTLLFRSTRWRSIKTCRVLWFFRVSAEKVWWYSNVASPISIGESPGLNSSSTFWRLIRNCWPLLINEALASFNAGDWESKSCWMDMTLNPLPPVSCPGSAEVDTCPPPLTDWSTMGYGLSSCQRRFVRWHFPSAVQHSTLIIPHEFPLHISLKYPILIQWIHEYTFPINLEELT